MRSNSNSPSYDDTNNSDSDSFIVEEGEASPILKYRYNRGKIRKPKRNKSAFILFSIEARPKIKALYSEKLNSNEMMEKLAMIWKELPTNELERFQLLAQQDKIRYKIELDDFSQKNPDEVIKNKTNKNHVKKPCSAYALFLKDIKDEIKEQYPELKMADVLKKVGERWRSLDDQQKKKYQKRSDAEKRAANAKLGKNQDKIGQGSMISKRSQKSLDQEELQKKVKVQRPNTRLQSKLSANSPNEFLKPLVNNVTNESPKKLIFSIIRNRAPKGVNNLLINDMKASTLEESPFYSEEATDGDMIEFRSNNSEKIELLDFISFDQKPLRIEDLDFVNDWMMPNEFESDLGLTDGILMERSGSRFSCTEDLNNAIMGNFDVKMSENATKLRREDAFSNSKYFSLESLKVGL